jgi:ornithine lipid ester-linked acyl 2-hydroxylase
MNWLILNIAAFTPYVREGAGKHREWERAFHRGR